MGIKGVVNNPQLKKKHNPLFPPLVRGINLNGIVVYEKN